MNGENSRKPPIETEEAQRTAHALGQLKGEEEQQVETRLDSDLQGRKNHQQIQQLAEELQIAWNEMDRPEHSAALRQAIDERLSSDSGTIATQLDHGINGANARQPKPNPLKPTTARARVHWVVVALAVCLLLAVFPIRQSLLHRGDQVRQPERVAMTMPTVSSESLPAADSVESRQRAPSDPQQVVQSEPQLSKSEALVLAEQAKARKLALEVKEIEKQMRISLEQAALAKRADQMQIRALEQQIKLQEAVKNANRYREAGATYYAQPPPSRAPIAAGTVGQNSTGMPQTNQAGGGMPNSVPGVSWGSNSSRTGMGMAGMMGGGMMGGGMMGGGGAAPANARGGDAGGGDAGGGDAGGGYGMPAAQAVPPPPASATPNVLYSNRTQGGWAYDTGHNRQYAVAGERRGEASYTHRGRANLKAFGRGGNQEQYAQIVENQFLAVTQQPLSTFSIDVDTASYANVRRFLTQNSAPPANAVRIEELVNYFSYDYPQPDGSSPFSVSMEVAQCPWQTAHRLLRIGLQGRAVPQPERPAGNLVFLLDVSGSMSDDNKLPLLKQGMKLLVDQLGENDRVSIVTYAGQAGLKLDATSGHRRHELKDAINSLASGGSTNGSAGIELAYQKAAENFIEKGVNRVILATDGDLNVGVTSDDQLVSLIKRKAKSGVFLTVLGFGQGNLKDGKLENLADHGNGHYAYIDSLREARKVLVEQVAGSLQTIAKDVKVKVEFNPAQVDAYRLIGYENRLMSAAEFDDDRKDAGEIGAGHAVTVLYELVPAASANRAAAVTGTLKYQRAVEPPPVPDPALTEAAKSAELLTVSLRYKQPDGNVSQLREFTIDRSNDGFGVASSEFRFAAAVAAFGMLLRGSEFSGDATFSKVESIAEESLGTDAQGYRTEFLDLVRKASTLRGHYSRKETP